MSSPLPDPFAGWTARSPRPVAPTPAVLGTHLRGRRVLVGLPGVGWRGDLRADEKVVQGSRTYVPVMAEQEWYRSEAERTEVFAPLMPVERVWVEELGLGDPPGPAATPSKLVSLDEPPRRRPVPAIDADVLTGRRVVQLDGEHERRDLRAVTELHTGAEGDVCARVAAELDWYRWVWSGHAPQTTEVPANRLWVE